VIFLEIQVDNNKKIIEIWLANNEEENVADIVATYNQLKYTIAIFKSGCGNLFENTKQLLAHNKQV